MADITLSGLLYEGCYDEWIKRMDCVLKLHYGCSIWWLRRMSPMAQSTPQKERVKRIEDIAAVIRANVHPRLLVRVPEKDRTNARLLLPKLESLAKPFPLTSLPANVRKMVYELVGYEQRSSHWETRGALNLVSHSVRDEAFPLYIRYKWFHCHASLSNEYAERNNVVYYARKLAEGEVRGHAKELRTFCLHLNSEKEWKKKHWTRLTFTFSKEKGLAVDCRYLDSVSEALVRKHVANVEANRKVLGLQGEAIILALVSKPELWVKGALKQPK